MNKSTEERRFESLLPAVSVLTGSLSPQLFMALMAVLDRVADTVTGIDQSTVESAADMMAYMEENRDFCDKRLAIAVMRVDKGAGN